MLAPRGLLLIETKWRRSLTHLRRGQDVAQANRAAKDVASMLTDLGEAPPSPIRAAVVYWGPAKDSALVDGRVHAGVLVVSSDLLLASLRRYNDRGPLSAEHADHLVRTITSHVRRSDAPNRGGRVVERA